MLLTRKSQGQSQAVNPIARAVGALAQRTVDRRTFIKGAGLGERPRAEPIRGIDAYFWIKPPGESDGVSDPKAPRYDEMCSFGHGLVRANAAPSRFDRWVKFDTLVAKPRIMCGPPASSSTRRNTLAIFSRLMSQPSQPAWAASR